MDTLPPRAKRRDAKYSTRAEQMHSARAETRAKHDVRFVGVDGEGVTNPDDSHDYVLLSVGSESLHNNGAPIHLDQILEFLWEQYLADPDAVFVGFYLGYDFTMWLRELPYDRAWMLFDPEGIKKRARKGGNNPIPFPVYYGDWEMDLHAGKRFKLRRKGYPSWLYICDAGPFFQSSFMRAIDPASWPDPIVNNREYAALQEGKNSRATATFGLPMIHYNTLENDVLARLMGELNIGFVAMGINLRKSQWYGPGQVAQAWLNNIAAPTRDNASEWIPYEILEAGRASYYGGWFVITAHGHLPGITYEYDRNSAYPYAIANLPCFEHGKWESRFSPSELCLVDATVRQTTKRRLGTMPHRTQEGKILQPRRTRGWYWRHEIAAAMRAGAIQDVQTHQAWSFRPECNHRPFAAITDLYELRRKVGKNTPLGKALKLTYNSAYGKLAQSVGSPKYSNPIYASLITSDCRTAMWDAIATHPVGIDAVTMVATDGLYFTSPHPTLPLSDKLGDWSAEEKHNMCQFMPGLYWDDKTRDDTGPLKSRGVSGADMRGRIEWIDKKMHAHRRLLIKPPTRKDIKNLAEIFGKAGAKYLATAWPGVDIPIAFGLISAKLAMHRHAWHTAGTIDRQTKCLSSDPVDKRNPKSAFVDDVGRIWTEPYDVAPGGVIRSVGYDKRFGIDLQFRLLDDERLTQDGTIQDAIYDWVRA